jgi:hypothetical protein
LILLIALLVLAETRLVPGYPRFCGTLGRQTQLNENGQMVSDNGIEILLDTDILAVCCVRRLGKPGS